MIALTNITKSYGERILLNNISLSINRGEKIGLIGPNGAGKSTLFSIILNSREASSGTINIQKTTRIGYLPQEVHFSSNITVLGELLEGNEKIKELLAQKKALELANQAGGARYGDILHTLETMGYFALEHTAKKILAGLGFKETDFTRPVQALSGGWKMRVLLAKLLTYDYDLLLLDEPTNHLDLSAALWFKDYLAAFKGTFVMVSHDRDFLDEVTDYTLILENGAIVKIHGNYEHYLKIRGERKIYLVKQFKEQEKKRKQLQEFIDRFHAQPNKASQVRAKRKEIERMEEIIVPPDRRESIRSFHFPQTHKSGQSAMRLANISKAYGSIQVYNNFDFEITRGEKAVLVGENGAGKSTLLKILAGVIDIDSGTRVAGYNTDVGYFSQTRMDVLSPENTVLQETFTSAREYISEESIRTILGAFLFSGSDVEKKVSVLSGGEKSRLILAKLLIRPPNLLLLDEPTTHLDVDAVDALIQALAGYEGTLVFISHDIHFVRSTATMVYEVSSGRVRKFPGNFDYYRSQKDKTHVVTRAKPGKRTIWQETFDELKARSKQRYRTPQEEEETKAHNAQLSLAIKALRKEKEKLAAERAVKERIIANKFSHHGASAKQQYTERLRAIDERMGAIEE
ncbi:MAG: ATP-binding cassette domain-containing protein, partial [Candidatus Omnitrophica bacterium]|nr:ATP-binding cassette domain-containing protein [Candidatus Omnitrophota bacterium]